MRSISLATVDTLLKPIFVHELMGALTFGFVKIEVAVALMSYVWRQVRTSITTHHVELCNRDIFVNIQGSFLSHVSSSVSLSQFDVLHV